MATSAAEVSRRHEVRIPRLPTSVGLLGYQVLEHRLFRLSNATAHCFLRLFADSTGHAPAFARGVGCAVETLSCVDPSLAAALEQLKSQVDALKKDETLELGDARCQFVRWWPARFAPPKPWVGPRAELLSVLEPRICDLELEDCLDQGTARILIKRELVTRGEAEHHQATWRERGLLSSVASARSGPGYILFGSSDQQLLNHAVLAETDLAKRDSAGDAATTFLGHSLGYPDCCIAALVCLNRRDDFHAALFAIPAWPHRRYDPLAAWLNPKLTLLSHFPCGLDCARSLERARQLLAIAERHSPGLRVRWSQVVGRIHAIDSQGRHLLIQATDRAKPGTLKLQDVCWVRTGQPGKLTQLPEFAEQLAEPDGCGFATHSGSLRVIIAADHRPAGSLRSAAPE